MNLEYVGVMAFGLVTLFIVLLIVTYLNEKKLNSLRRERAILKGWNYESFASGTMGFKVSGTDGSHKWELEQRKGKDNNRPLMFTSKSIYLNNDVFLFADKKETDILLKPFMQYVLKLGTVIAPKDSNHQKAETFSLLKEAKPLDIHCGNSKWNYGAIATSTDFGYKVFSLGFQAEIDSLSLIDISSLPPSIILCPDGLEIKWQIRKLDADKMETIIDSSLRLMNILDKAIRN